APGGGGRVVEEELGQGPLAGRDGVAIEERDGAHDLARADVEADRQPVLDRLLHVAQAVEADGDDLGGLEEAGGGDLLAALDVLVADAGEVDGGAHAAMHFLDGLVMVLQRADADALAAREPFDLVAGLQGPGMDGAGDDGAVALDHEAAVDGKAKPVDG